MHRAAHIVTNTEGLPAPAVARRLDGLCGAMSRHRARAGGLCDAVGHFLKVTRSYRPGLFHCHAVDDLPGTNNALEGLFGSYRYCQRRTTGRRAASAATVVSDRPISPLLERAAFELLNGEPVAGWAEASVGLQ